MIEKNRVSKGEHLCGGAYRSRLFEETYLPKSFSSLVIRFKDIVIRCFFGFLFVYREELWRFLAVAHLVSS